MVEGEKAFLLMYNQAAMCCLGGGLRIFLLFFVDVTGQTLLSHTATYKSHRLLTSSLTLYCIVTVCLNKALFKSNVVVSI